MSELPMGWCFAQISELCSLINGKSFRSSEWSNEGMPIIRIQNLNNPNAMFNYYSGGLPEQFIVRKGDLLFAWSGTPGTSFGAHTWNGEVAALNQHIFNIRFNKELINHQFFKYAINQNLEGLIGNAQGGVGLRHISKAVFEKTRIYFPPLAEQNRIVDKLDTLFALIESTTAKLECLPAATQKLFSILTEADKSTTSLLGDHTTECTKRIGETWKEYPLIGVSNTEGVVPLRTGKRTEFPDYKIVNPGDFIYNTMRVNIGSIGIYRGDVPALTSPDYVVFRTKSTISPEFVLQFLKSSFGLEEINKNTKGSVRSRLYYSSLAKLTIPISIEYTQDEVESFFISLRYAREKSVKVKLMLETVKTGLLGKAFRGELVPQDPDDEPASVLLERIRKERVEKRVTKKGATNKSLTVQSTETENAIPVSEVRIDSLSRTKMKKNATTAIKEMVSKNRSKEYTFDDIRSALSLDYEELRDGLFELLNEEEPLLRQVFDKSKPGMVFEKVVV